MIPTLCLAPYLVSQLSQDPHLPHGRHRKAFAIVVFLFDALEGHQLSVRGPGGLVNLFATYHT